ncbi:hypothetical protein W02_21530 [Nitrospira sp. KM1]|uniref:protease inhibitor I42 family protein n=1 Tax=Nitrospira sp. KM1 TaxID=1936990 RepID=UPI0013A70D79|nr:protease inhibitor I42 family protein [Nitrospira sp. KM1]BCA55013.1 hypothetical protein W02_21530 [Nitrospira sp. KM1]
MTQPEEGRGVPSGGVKLVEGSLHSPIRIHLWEDRTRGELWVPTYDGNELTLIADDYLRIAGNNAVDNGRRTFEFRAVKPGTYRVVFEKRMGWKFTAEDRRIFQVSVVPVSNPQKP